MNDAAYMKRALRLAGRGRGRTSPNPMVGAVVVRSGKIMGEGYHRKAGTAHAEAVALGRAGGQAKGATLYVTLEPCCHLDKRTPPCTDAILASGVRRVVVSMKDPNPKVSGKGISLLRKAGVQVDCGLLEDEAALLNEAYCKHIATGMPFVTLKAAMTLDGKIATPEGASKWITGEASRRLVHRMRSESDAVLTAIGTVRADDPELTCRTGGRSPLRVVIDPDLSIPPESRILRTPPGTIVVARVSANRKAASAIRAKGVTIIDCRSRRVDLHWLMAQLGAKGIVSVMVEAGGSLNASCLDAGIVDKVAFFIAPKIMGGKASVPVVGGSSYRLPSEMLRLSRTTVKKVGDDVLITGYLSSS
ncbi:MAG: bifunctional diaminohydroxyphosphoribosylaminopyrimidine deaminase/5-amino-6-(5-phosphoribosylamino)uracil reductase RibD [Thermodesulfovibrionales bacterium]